MTRSFISIIFIIPYCFAEIWYVDVYTGNERFAGTDSDVFISLTNSEGERTREYKLTHSNWLRGKHEFYVRNLFEMGAQEKFEIHTEEFLGNLASIQIRQNNFPPLHADWLLDQVIVERHRDGTKYVFKCNCWLRKNRPYITLYPLPDPRSSDKNKTNKSSSTFTRIFVTILIVLIVIIIGAFCCYNEYRRRKRRSSSPSNSIDEQIQQEPPLLDPYCPSSIRPPPPSSSSSPHFWMNTLHRWKNFRHNSPSDDHPRTTTTVPRTTTTSPEEPPSYDDLYPNTTTPINITLNSNS